jgi:lipopolysaccharide biosynthesis glycosyltransferase
MTAAIFTIVSRNYFGYAKALAQSVAASNGAAADFHILVVDPKDEAFARANPGCHITWVEDLQIPGFEGIAFKYDILELNTNVKPSFAKHLLKRYEKIIYLDPDIYVYGSLAPIFAALDDHPVVLTPHITAPIDDDRVPGEQELLRAGIYNLGFAAFNRAPAAVQLLDWWERRCLGLAYDEQSQGLFVDQKWMNFAPAFCDRLLVLKEPQYNVAYWNLHERRLTRQDGVYLVNDEKPLVFFHFSGLPAGGNETISKYQNRYTLTERTDLVAIFEAYRACLAANEQEEYARLPYGFGAFSNDVRITGLARRVASEACSEDLEANPFDARGRLYASLLRSGLIDASRKRADGGPTDRKPGGRTTRVGRSLMQLFFKVLLRLLGPERYFSLLRYLTSQVSARKQQFLIKRP